MQDPTGIGEHCFSDFEVKLPCLPVRGDISLSDLFGPLGYRVHITEFPLDAAFPEWGQSPYVSCSLVAAVTLKELLNHLYVLIPVLDDEKHYWIDEAEVEKLLRRGDPWLAQHPKRELIVARYLKRRRQLVTAALSQLIDEEGAGDELSEDSTGSKQLTRTTFAIGGSHSQSPRQRADPGPGMRRWQTPGAAGGRFAVYSAGGRGCLASAISIWENPG